ncbi:MAG TPA: hypothetical protein VFA43_17475 [Gemmatimonadaceae bacterium]|nr:hypothetical protein [Gemmatimonadaceae bacterium]
MSVPDEGAIAAEQQLLNEPLYQDLRPVVVGFADRLQRAAATEEWVSLHRDLLIEFGARQDAADQALPQMRQQMRREIRELARRTPKPLDEIRARQAVLERVGRQELVARASQHTLRQVGDGIAWRALHYDRRAFTVLGEEERVGRLARGVGREAELAELARLWEEEGVFAIHNDLTNCLRHGDLTALRQRDGEIDVTLIEVKAGPRPGDTPQLQRLARATELLREGRHVNETGAVRITVVPAAYETYLDFLTGLIGEARDTGYAWARPHECLLVGAADYRVWGYESGEYNARSDSERRRIAWGAEEPETLAWTASMRRMRDRGWSFSSLAPYTIFPLPAEDVADLVMGFVDLAYGLHLPRLERALGRDGITAHVRRAGAGEAVFLEAARRDVRVIVPAHLREQMMVELMSPDALFALVDHVLTLNEERPEEAQDGRVVVFADEASVWERSATHR